MREKHIVRRSLNDRRTGRTDWSRVDQQTDKEIEAAVASDPDAAPLLTEDWMSRAHFVPGNKKSISIRLDPDVLDFFQAGGRNYQSRINEVLRAYVEAHRR